MASITEDDEWGEHITFAEMRNLKVQVKRTRDPYNSGDIHVEMRVIDPTFGPEGDQISSGQGYIDARTPNILDVEFVSSLGMSTREWMLQVVPKLKSVLGINRIQGYRATGAKSRREIKTIEDQDPIKNIQVIEFADVSDEIIKKHLIESANALIGEMKEVEATRTNSIYAAIKDTETRQDALSAADKIRDFMGTQYDSISHHFRRLSDIGKNIAYEESGSINYTKSPMLTIEGLLKRWALDVNTSYLREYIDNQRRKEEPGGINYRDY